MVLALAALTYAGVFAVFVFFESPGLGLGTFFFVPVCLVALVSDEMLGALAGVLATGLYVAAVVLAPAVPSAQALTTATGIRLVTYTIVGTLIDVGRGKIDESEFRRIVLARDRTQAGKTSPAHGLYLLSVRYGDSENVPEAPSIPVGFEFTCKTGSSEEKS